MAAGVLALIVAPCGAEDWTTAYAGLSRMSYVAGEALAPPFALQWEATLPTPLKGAPIVSGLLGHAYLCTETLQVWALKLSDGSVAWKHDEPRDLREVKCYDALSGALRWTQRVDGTLIHTPQVGQNVVYVATSLGTLYAFNQLDGKAMWQVALGSPLTLPAADAALVLIGSGSSLVGLNPANGAKVFTTDLGSAIGSVPVLADDGAYVALGDAVVAVNRAGGVRWTAKLLKPAWAPIAVTKAGVVAASVDGGVKLLARADGGKVWETVLAGTPNAVSGAGDVVYVGTRQGTVVGLRLTDGAKLWSAAPGHGVIDGVGVSGGRVLVTAGTWVGSLLPAPDAPDQLALGKDGKNSRLTWAATSPNGSPISAYRVWRRRGQSVAMLGTVGTPGFGEPLVAGEVGYQVTAIAANGAESGKSVEVTLAKGEPLLRKLAVGPLPLDPRTGTLTVTFDLRETARITWVVVDAEGRAVTDERTVSAAAGAGSLIWDGRNRTGAPAEPGVYRVTLQATAAAETDAQARAVPVLWGAGAGPTTGPLAGPASGGGASAAGQSGGGTSAGTSSSTVGPHDNGSQYLTRLPRSTPTSQVIFG
ncbi:MAG: PQQ-binding-like beta-propeller repeat protein [Candidatus Coatesbacteria bacterium]